MIPLSMDTPIRITGDGRSLKWRTVFRITCDVFGIRGALGGQNDDVSWSYFGMKSCFDVEEDFTQD